MQLSAYIQHRTCRSRNVSILEQFYLLTYLRSVVLCSVSFIGYLFDEAGSLSASERVHIRLYLFTLLSMLCMCVVSSGK